MRNASHSEREKFVALIQQHAGGDPTTRYSFAQRLMRYGATYGRLQEDHCNIGCATAGHKQVKISECDTESVCLKELRTEHNVGELCAAFDCKAIFSGDPRGNTLKIEVPSKYSNSWGGEGICVPTS